MMAEQQREQDEIEEPSEACTASLVSQLRGIHKDAWCEVENPNGFTYHTNIGILVHRAASRIAELEEQLT